MHVLSVEFEFEIVCFCVCMYILTEKGQQILGQIYDYDESESDTLCNVKLQ